MNNVAAFVSSLAPSRKNNIVTGLRWTDLPSASSGQISPSYTTAESSVCSILGDYLNSSVEQMKREFLANYAPLGDCEKQNDRRP